MTNRSHIMCNKILIQSCLEYNAITAAKFCLKISHYRPTRVSTVSRTVEKVSLIKKHIALTFPVSIYLFPIAECINLWLDLYLTRTQDFVFLFLPSRTNKRLPLGLLRYKISRHYCAIKFQSAFCLRQRNIINSNNQNYYKFITRQNLEVLNNSLPMKSTAWN